MQAKSVRAGGYRGFKATGATMYELAKLEPGFMGAVRTDGEGFLA